MASEPGTDYGHQGVFGDRRHRAEFLMNWFLVVFDGRKSPHPRRSLESVASAMRSFLAQAESSYHEKYHGHAED